MISRGFTGTHHNGLACSTFLAFSMAMCYFQTMKMVNINVIKARLSEYVDLVEQGETILICRRNRPVAELRALGVARTEPRPLGGTPIELPEVFFEPLPDDVIAGFYGAQTSGASTAAEAPERFSIPARPVRKRRARR
jgi:antitoxin (DNA-binding transcriptional repressor) of toxin-antitoxin stability system